MEIIKLKLSELKPLEKNVRYHNEKQISELVRSLEQFGQTRAIVIDEANNILIGNGLFMALKAKGAEYADCSRVVGLNDKQKKKLVITDNKVFSLGSDDYEVLTEFIKDITIDGDFDIAGFDDDVVRQLMKETEDITRDVLNYGNVSGDYIKQEQVQNRQDTPSSEINSTNAEERHTVVVQPEADVKAEVHNTRTIVCPNCGEVIYID